jgi:predicted membrane protein
MFSLELIALAAGVALLIYVKNQSKINTKFAAIVAWIVIVLSALSIICSVYNAAIFWTHGSGMHRSMMMHRMDKHKDMMDKKDHRNSMPESSDSMDEK